MRVRNWLSTLLKSVQIRLGRRQRRRWLAFKSRRMRGALATIAATALLASHAAGDDMFQQLQSVGVAL